MKKRAGKEFSTFMLPALVVLVLVLAVPLFYDIIVSFFDKSLKYQGLGNFIGLNNYIQDLKNDEFTSSIVTTWIFTIGVVSIEFLLGLLIALGLNNLGKGKNLIFTIIIIPMMITPVAVGLIWRLILHPQLGIFNYILSKFGVEKIAWLGDSKLALPTVMFVDIWQNIPYMVLVLMAGLVTLPKEPFEAAAIDGSSRIQSFFRLTVPMMMPTFSVVLLLRAIMSFKTYDLIYVMTRGGPGTVTQVISYTIYNQAYRYLRTGTAASMSIYLVLMIVPIAILFLWLSRSREE
ncbi:MAG: sugar ABC transporter permease [Clostridia bacterium]|nr:sugar ABC transporter permease [Clostridia bacterium]MBQ3663850.1 sugar ABC transporter permease [Clostridia bacterium]